MGALVVWDLIDQLGTGGIRGFVVVDQTTSDYKWPDWPHGMLDLDGLRHVMESVQTDRPGITKFLIDLMFNEPPAPEEEAWMREEIMRPPASVASAIIFDQTMRDYRPVLPKVDVPTLVVTGADEKLVSVAAEELIASEMPDARVVVFEESSHCPFLEETDRFNETVGEFVRSPAEDRQSEA
jgi:non-heme chloroperoxidase